MLFERLPAPYRQTYKWIESCFFCLYPNTLFWKIPLTFRVWPLATALSVPQVCPHWVSPQSQPFRVRWQGSTAARLWQAVWHLTACGTCSMELSAEPWQQENRRGQWAEEFPPIFPIADRKTSVPTREHKLNLKLEVFFPFPDSLLTFSYSTYISLLLLDDWRLARHC